MKKVFRLSCLFCLLLPLILALVLTQPASAAGTRISGAASADGEVKDYKIASTGAYVVYCTLKTDNTPHLYSVPLNGALPVSLTSPLPPESSSYTLPFKISQDGKRVVYVARQESISVYSLYTIPIAGGTPVRLSKSAVSVMDFAITPDNQWVVFTSFDASYKVHLYRAALSGGTGSAVDITPSGAQPTEWQVMTITPDSQYIVMLGNMAPLDGWGIYSISIANSQYTRISKSVSQQWMMEFLVTPDSQRVIYRFVDESTNPSTSRLYSVPIDGPATSITNLSGTIVSGGGTTSGFKISPDGRYVVFGAEKEVANKVELYSYFLASRFPWLVSPVKLNVPIADDKNVSYSNFQISPDSSRVAYFAYQSNMHDLFSVPIDGPIVDNVKLNQPINPSIPASWTDTFLFSPDSSKVIFTAMQDTPDYVDLYSIPAVGPTSAAVKINPPQVKAGGSIAFVMSPQVSADGHWVFYTMHDTLNRINLYQAPINGPVAKNLKLSNVSIDGGGISSFTQVPLHFKIVYQAAQTSSLLNELFVTDLASNVYLPLVKK